jgi:hypothetical protein
LQRAILPANWRRIATNETGYEHAFRRYEDARSEYARLQEEIHQFLARFSGNPKLAEAPFAIQDLARMVGLQAQRDAAYREYTTLERAIFDRLGRGWD